MKILHIAFLAGFPALIASAALADDRQLAEELRAVVEANIAATNGEDSGAVMATVHSKSPEFDATLSVVEDQFDEIDARSELVQFNYIGHDSEFAVARVRIRTTEQSDEPFGDNTIDLMTVFLQENGVWKIWSDLLLGIELGA